MKPGGSICICWCADARWVRKNGQQNTKRNEKQHRVSRVCNSVRGHGVARCSACTGRACVLRLISHSHSATLSSKHCALSTSPIHCTCASSVACCVCVVLWCLCWCFGVLRLAARLTRNSHTPYPRRCRCHRAGPRLVHNGGILDCSAWRWCSSRPAAVGRSWIDTSGTHGRGDLPWWRRGGQGPQGDVGCGKG